MEIALIIISAVFTALIGPYIIYRLNKQDQKGRERDNAIARVEVHVDGRLDDTIEEVKNLKKLIATSRVSGDPVPAQLAGGDSATVTGKVNQEGS
jgi:hypothetical protein